MTFDCPPGIHIQWSPANQAFLVCRHETVLRILPDADDVCVYLREITP